jgi:hypothetical protein
MKRWFLATALLFVSAGLASADYVIIMANLGPTKDKDTQPGGGNLGVPGFPGGIPPGGIGGRPTGVGGGAAGIGGVPPGGIGGKPTGVGGGGPPSGAFVGGAGGARGGPPGMMGMGGVGMMGMRGGMMGMRGQMGMIGMGGVGMMGMRGGQMGMMGMGGVGMMGMMGFRGMGGPTNVDDVPYFILAVVEVEPITPNANLYKKLHDKNNPLPSLRVKHDWGKSRLFADVGFCKTVVLTEDAGSKPMKTVKQRFDKQFAELFKDKPTADLIVEFADKGTLQLGLVEEFPKVMAKLKEIDPNHPAIVAFTKVQAALDKPLQADDSAAGWRNKLLNGYKVTPEGEHDHYVILHNSATASDEVMQRHLKTLEKSFRGYYYWFALRGIELPVPKHRQLAVVTSNEKDFEHFHKILTAGPVVVDGFFARRENVSVMASERQDDSYDRLKKAWALYGEKGYRATDLLKGVGKAGRPLQAPPEEVAVAEMMALLMKAMEREAELATISHDASRQMVFSSGLLPRNVAAPEWCLFGMGSFFETPLQSPWAGIGAPSTYYLPRWRELKGKGLEKTAADTLRMVVTDTYFRNLPPKGEPDSPVRQVHDAALRKARTTAWALTYFLAREKLDGLQRYFKELGKMPRDIELDEEVLMGCFARAFNLLDNNNKIEKAKLSSLANQWYSYVDNVHFDSEEIMKKVRKEFQDALTKSQGGDQTPPSGNPPGVFPPNGGPNGRPPIVPPIGGGVRPGGGGRPPAK